MRKRKRSKETKEEEKKRHYYYCDAILKEIERKNHSSEADQSRAREREERQ